MQDRLVYLDHAATTALRPEVRAAMEPYFAEVYANPSGSHRFARTARRAIDEARDRVAGLLGCGPSEVIFTSGGTESDNTAVLGVPARRGGRALCPAAEHHAVLHAVEASGGVVVACDSTGHVDLGALAEGLAANPDVSVVSVMTVNNEVGTVTRMDEVAEIVRRHAPRSALHTDAVQGATWLDLRPVTAVVDLLALSAHKFGGPKGVGVLVAKAGVAFEPRLVGGGQESERRSGTHNVPGIVGLAEALALADRERPATVERVGALRDRLVGNLKAAVPGLIETLPAASKVAGSAHVCIPGVENEALLYLLDEAGVCASAASACAAGAMEPSHVLAAMGVPTEVARGALRLTLGPPSTAADVDLAVEVVGAAAHRLLAAGSRR